jgi:hypothetical protein
MTDMMEQFGKSKAKMIGKDDKDGVYEGLKFKAGPAPGPAPRRP